MVTSGPWLPCSSAFWSEMGWWLIPYSTRVQRAVIVVHRVCTDNQLVLELTVWWSMTVLGSI